MISQKIYFALETQCTPRLAQSSSLVPMLKIAFLVLLVNLMLVSAWEQPTPVVYIQLGINGVLQKAPEVYGISGMQAGSGLSISQLAELQANAEAEIAQRAGIHFPPGSVGENGKKNTTIGFQLVALTIPAGYGYHVLSLYDSTNSLPAFKPNSAEACDQVPVTLVEFVASPYNMTLVAQSGFVYGGIFGAQEGPAFPAGIQVTAFDNFAYGYYNFTDSRRNQVITNHRTFKVSRGGVLLPDVAFGEENFQLCSAKWGTGRTVLEYMVPTGAYPAPTQFLNNQIHPDITGFQGYTPWTDCPAYDWQ